MGTPEVVFSHSQAHPPEGMGSSDHVEWVDQLIPVLCQAPLTAMVPGKGKSPESLRPRRRAGKDKIKGDCSQRVGAKDGV